MPALALTEASQALFVEIFQRARHWNGEPILDEVRPLTPAEKGNLTDLKQKGLLTTWVDEGCTWCLFTEAGIAFGSDLLGFDHLGQPTK